MIVECKNLTGCVVHCQWRAPEEYRDDPLDEKIDIWSLGNNMVCDFLKAIGVSFCYFFCLTRLASFPVFLIDWSVPFL